MNRLIDWLGEWNPQLFRELKGRIKQRNILTVTALSFIGQVLLLRSFYYLKMDWFSLFMALTWIVPLLLFAGGGYLLSGDIIAENRRGTLNFIRLSPHSSQSILLGKTLGVPALLYFAIALVLPLHLWSAIAAGIPVGWFLSFYMLVGVGCFFGYCVALRGPLVAKSPVTAMGSGILGGFLAIPYISFILAQFDWSTLRYSGIDWQWFFLPVGRQPVLALIWMLFTIGVVDRWMWKSLNNGFFNYHFQSELSKRQTYTLVAGFEIWLMGLFWPFLNMSGHDSHLLYALVMVILGLNIPLFIVISTAIAPGQQGVEDKEATSQKPEQRRRNKEGKGIGFQIVLPRWSDIMWAKKSPSRVAIAFYFAIALWLPWLVLFPANLQAKLKAISMCLLTINSIGLYIIFIMMVALLFYSPRLIFRHIGSLVLAISLPLICLYLSTEQSAPISVWELFKLGSYLTQIIETQATVFVLFCFLIQSIVINRIVAKLHPHMKKPIPSLL